MAVEEGVTFRVVLRVDLVVELDIIVTFQEVQRKHIQVL
jgi:hypothetical protein